MNKHVIVLVIGGNFDKDLQESFTNARKNEWTSGKDMIYLTKKQAKNILTEKGKRITGLKYKKAKK